MHLKSLTLKGFKSFASPTTLKFEPGISAVVGPNGSGKSNVVDALTWVMGEGSAKSLRGGNMQDVIFAGTSGKSALGRAEVTLTIDNADGALPIEYAEVSVTRRVFRDGAGEYEINGSKCRLMDVQELLSDSGIGREMHIVVGQGKLSEILESRPEERRAFIEEAAGVLKHRRRKEKAQRKLAGMQGNLDRLTDLTDELRKQLKPLGRQAELARRAQSIQADLRDASLRVAADDVSRRRDEMSDAEGDRAELERRMAAAADRQHELADVVTAAEAELETVAPAADAAQNRWYTLSALTERTRATTRIGGERARGLAESRAAPRGTDPDELDRRADEAETREHELAAEVTRAGEALTAAQTELETAEQHADRLEQEHRAAVQAVADRREGLARLSGRSDTLLARIESTEAEIERLAGERATAEETVRDADAEMETLGASLDEHASAEETLDSQLGRSEQSHRDVVDRRESLRDRERELERSLAGLEARVTALSQGLGAEGGVEWVREQLGDQTVAGALGDVLTVSSGWEKAVAVALGEAVDALVVDRSVDPHTVLRDLRDADGGRAGIVGRVSGSPEEHDGFELTPGAVRGIDEIGVPDDLLGAVSALLRDVVLVGDLPGAVEQLERDPRARVVTREGEIVTRGLVVGGSGPGRTGLEIRAAVEQTERQLSSGRDELEKIRRERAGAESESESSAEQYEESFAAIRESDSAVEALYEQLARTGQRRRRAEAELRRIGQAHRFAAEKLDSTRAEYSEIAERLEHAADEQVDDPDGDGANGDGADGDGGRAAADETLAAKRSAEVEARLALRTAEERLEGVSGTSERLRRSAAAEREARERAERAEAVRRRDAEAAGVVTELGERLLVRLAELLDRADDDRKRLAAGRAEVADRLAAGRSELAEAEKELARVSDNAHREEILRAQIEVRLSELESSVLEKYGMEADVLVAEYGPHLDLPPTELEVAEYEAARERGEEVSRPPDMPYVREEQLARRKRAEKELARLGKVNPLALEEFAALEERYGFLSTQLDDVKKARADLEGVIDDVDERIETVFAEAYYDVEREFSRVFEVLFPGGEGRLVLTDPDDMLTSGIEVEARPPGKKVKRLSLLSGGEKSLTAVAMLVAIFRARPSPFYVLDEIEAALDDTNLRRLISLLENLRASSQLIVITHQKATMDVADVLYGVSMRGDGMSRVISHRMR